VVGPPPASWAVDAHTVRAWELRPGLWHLRLPAPWHHLTHVNAFALDHPDGGIVLIDCGCAGHLTAWTALERALELAGRRMEDVRELVITHYHTDHMGPARSIAFVSGCAIWGHPATRHLFEAVEQPDKVYAERLAFARGAGAPEEWHDAVATVGEELQGAADPPPPDRPLLNGVTVAGLQVIETPGHAPSHVCLYEPERRLLFAGDLLTPVFTSYGDWGYTPDPTGEFRASVESIAGLDVDLTLLGHGRPAEDFAGLVSLYRDGFTQRFAAVEAALPGTAWEVALRVFGASEHDSALVWNLYEAWGYLNHLVRSGRVRHDGDRYARLTAPVPR
jgi:glyoxylase-like metal-dependent hydrolase (beta-lactamase superfamily II)